MNFQTEKICRLCLKTSCQNNFEEIDEITSEMLDVLRVKLDLTLTDEPVMCNECVKDLQESFEFKSICLYNEDDIYPLLDSNDKLDLKDIYLKQNNMKTIDISENQKICRLCLNLMEIGLYMPLTEKLNNTFNVLNVLNKYIPELKLNATEAPVICLPCLDSVQHLSSFLINTLSVEKKIIKYIQTEGKNKKEKVTLDMVKKCLSNNKKAGELFIRLVDCLKTEEDVTNIEIENRSSMESEEIKKEIDEDIMVKMEHEEDCNEDLEMSIKNEEIEIKSELIDSGSVVNISTSSKPRGSNMSSERWRQTFKCRSCPYKTFRKHHFRRHMLIHEDPSNIKMYKCEKCTFETKHEGYIEKHMWCHHRDPLEITIYKCKHCTFKSKRKEAYRKHLIYHTNPSAVKIYQCEKCEYKTLYKNTYAYHSLTHKDVSEAQEMFKCNKCTYESKHRQCLTRHKLIHRDPSEVTKFQCNICNYQGNSNKVLKRHMITHKDPSEVRMFKCNICAYQSKYSNGIKLHERTHKDPSELTMHKCTVCTYETKYKGSFKNHMKTHEK